MQEEEERSARQKGKCLPGSTSPALTIRMSACRSRTVGGGMGMMQYRLLSNRSGFEEATCPKVTDLASPALDCILHL